MRVLWPLALSTFALLIGLGSSHIQTREPDGGPSPAEVGTNASGQAAEAEDFFFPPGRESGESVAGPAPTRPDNVVWVLERGRAPAGGEAAGVSAPPRNVDTPTISPCDAAASASIPVPVLGIDPLYRQLRADGDLREVGGEAHQRLPVNLTPSLVAPSGEEWQTVGTAPVPPDLPNWFRSLDTNAAGQVSLHEWRANGRRVADLQRMDRNGDGFLTAEEVHRFVTESAGHGTFGLRASVASIGTPRAVAAPSPSALSHPPPQPSPSPTRGPTAPSQPAAAPTISDLDRLATTALPLDRRGNSYWQLRDKQNEARARQGHAPVLFLGDSITDLLKSGAGQPVWDTCFAPLGAEDFAVGGLTTSEVLWQVQTGQVAALTPDVVILLIGTNNLSLGQSPAAVAAGVTEVVGQIQDQLPQTRILLLGVLPRGQSSADPFRAKVAQVNRILAASSLGDAVAFLDIGDAYLQPDGTMPATLMPDYLHPSPLGYDLYAAAIWQPLLDLLGSE